MSARRVFVKGLKGTAERAAEKVEKQVPRGLKSARSGKQKVVSGTTEDAAEKSKFQLVLKGHGFSRAVQVLYFCHPSRASARGGSAFSLFSAASSAVPFGASLNPGFSP